jgi:nitrate/nitrite-specific signal transduction histidine kinase
MSRLWFISATVLFFIAPFFVATTATTEAAQTSVVSVNIDTIELDTKGLEQSLIRVEQQLSDFSQAILLASGDDSPLTPQDKQRLQLTIEELHKSSSAMTSLLQSMPVQLEKFNQQIPQMIQSFHQPISELAASLQLAQGGLVSLAMQAPSIINQAESSFEQSLDTLSWRLTLIVIIILIVLFVILVISIWGLNRHVIQPLSQTVAIMNSLPEQQLKTAELLSDISQQLMAVDANKSSDLQHETVLSDLEK